MAAALTQDTAPVRRTRRSRHPAAFVRRLRGDGTLARRRWRTGYVRSIVALDALCGLVAGLAGYTLRFDQVPGMSEDAAQGVVAGVALGLPVVWVLAMFATAATSSGSSGSARRSSAGCLPAPVWTLAAVGDRELGIPAGTWPAGSSSRRSRSPPC